MGRRKQSRPHRSGGILPENSHLQSGDFEDEETAKSEPDTIDKPFFVEVDRASTVSDDHLDISEIVLSISNSTDAIPSCLKDGDFHENSKYSLRLRLSNISKVLGRLKLGNWPVLPSSDIALEFFQNEKTEMELKEEQPVPVLLRGTFDGPDEGISGLVHLVSLKFLSLRPVLEAPLSKNLSFLRLRVEILHNAFNGCDSLLDTSRKLWKKSMMNAMAWLRPEVVTSEARYGLGKKFGNEADEHYLENKDSISADNSPNHAKFDVALFYEDIKPSKANPMLDSNMPELLVELRPYQRRAAYWMVEREKGDSRNIDEGEINQLISPLCMPLEFLDSHSKMFYNPFSGNISLQREPFLRYVRGGILADEMGLGKTVELLACIFSNRISESSLSVDNESPYAEYPENKLKRLKRERVECSCGAVSESHKYKGLWVQCDICDAWQHAACVGYSPNQKTIKFREVSGKGEYKMGHKRKNGVSPASVTDNEYICQPCLELSQATDSPVATGATLIVCPAPILLQWHYEIKRHTHPGSIKTYIYEGVREISLSNASLVPMSNLINADIVLTTYDVLKEDLSHDSDRHEGDRRFMRFQKRYPVLPTLLTRIFWWRVCLDEAQMVESNAGAATEMASRLHAKHHWCITGTPIQRKLDDLYGLLRFIQASPFNIMRWWVEVIRDPYERRDAGAMDFTHKFFKQIMWRSSKRYVADELLLPPQEECITWLTFSQIEKYFYQRQHESCVSFAREVIESLKDDRVKRKVPGDMTSAMQSDFVLTHADVGKLLSTLLKLRQACCHPQVGSSGLRSLQQSPMTMEEILMVLVGKTKVEGEEALRRTVVALNALAGIAILENRFSEAVSIYKEALSLAEEHSEDFRLDPLLNIHIHHNLSDILPLTRDHSTFSEIQTAQGNSEKSDEYEIKKQKISETCSVVNVAEKQSDNPFNLSGEAVNGGHVFNKDLQRNSSFNDDSLRKACENLRQKYLVMFTSKLSVAQQEFRKSYTQICSTLSQQNKQHEIWWLEALHYADQNKDFSIELMRKIEEAILGTQNKSQSRIASRFASINILKYHVQTGLDLLESSRKVVLDRISEIDETLENPKDEDIERVRNCQNCQADSTGPPCVLCELDELFQDYEARLFRLSKVHGGAATSVEEAVKFQKKKSALNRFYWSLSQQNKNSNSWQVENEESSKRDVGEKFMVSKQPSELEVVLGIIKSYCKVQLGKDGVLAANNQLQLLESMRKEYAHARSLAIAQAQVLNAYDELKMATMRLCLSEDDNDKSVYALSEHELPAANVQYSSDKFVSLTLLTRIKGKLRYLKGLVLSKQNIPLGNPDNFSLPEEVTCLTTSTQNDECVAKTYEETCPVCQEKLSGQKMVFQCGHITCCKCFFAMMEQKLVQTNCVTCPTCRQLTDFGNIAYADDSHNKSFSPSVIDTKRSPDEQETAIKVQGSYGTKIEAVTRRILWIKSTDPEAKVLVFSSWNDVLDVLQHALTANEINYIRMKGGRKSHIAISKFRGQNRDAKETSKTHFQSTETTSHIQVLLLLIQHGANGLNLLEAQHVVLVEPLLNPAVEAQAISRVHRIGQEKKTLVHRFIVKDTVEESIYKLNRSRDISSFITGNVKNKDESFLTLKDVELLFATVSHPPGEEEEEKPGESLRHFPPSVAATMAAQRRLEVHTL